MDTLTVILIMVGVAVLLLVGAILSDRMLQRRIERRRLAEESGTPSDKKDAADAIIDLLDRSSEAVRRALRSGTESEQGQRQNSTG